MTHRTLISIILPALAALLTACGAMQPATGPLMHAESAFSVADERAAAAKAQISAAQSDEKQVLDALSDLAGAVNTRDAAAFERYCGADALDWHDIVRKAAAAMNRDELEALPKVTKFAVLRMRHAFTRDELTQTPRKELFRSAVARGAFVSPTVLRDARPGAIMIDGNRAQLSLAEAPELFIFTFRREAGAWKIVWSDLLEMDEAALPEQIAQSGLTEDDFMIERIERDTGVRVDRKILDGPLTALAPQPMPEATTFALEAVKDASNYMRISIPSDWRRVNRRGALLHAQATAYELSITVTGVRSLQDSTLAEFAPQAISQTLRSLRDGRIESIEDAVINDSPARLYTLSYTVEEAGKPAYPVRAMHIVVQHERRYYQITASCAAARFGDNEPLLWQMIASFQALK